MTLRSIVKKVIGGIIAGIFAMSAYPSLFAQSVPITFREYLERRLSPKKLKEICSIDTDPISLRVFTEYGSMFVSERVTTPPTCFFASAEAVDAFHKKITVGELVINGTKIELQKRASDALYEATQAAASLGKRIAPLDGSIAAKRNYQDTLRIWNSRFWPALDHWVAENKIERKDAEAAISMPLPLQIGKVVEWESKGLYFSTGFSKSIFYSVAPPGTSQHLSMIAFDVVETSDPQIRKILNDHGWFQTIKTDEPHFTYLGLRESELPSRGLKQFTRGGHTFWIPNI